MKYKAGYKYQLVDEVTFMLPIQSGIDLKCGSFLRIYASGKLQIKAGYAWDGCSGPTWDDDGNMKAGLVHDALYQFMRYELLPRDTWKPIADQLLYDISVESGMSRIRAWYYKLAVDKFGHDATITKRKVYKI